MTGARAGAESGAEIRLAAKVKIPVKNGWRRLVPESGAGKL